MKIRLYGAFLEHLLGKQKSRGLWLNRGLGGGGVHAFASSRAGQKLTQQKICPTAVHGAEQITLFTGTVIIAL